jgi:hypothetical protein
VTAQQWLAEAGRRIKLSESCRLYKYRDTVRDADHPIGVVTAAWGWNCERSDTEAVFTKFGVTWSHFSASPIAVDSDPANAVAACLTQPQADSIFDVALDPVIGQARSSLASGVFDALSDPRRFVIVDLCYNLGEAGWLGFGETRSIIAQAQLLKNQGRLVQSHSLWVEAGQRLKASDWYGQVGARAQRDVAMLVSGEWADATGNGSDVAA